MDTPITCSESDAGQQFGNVADFRAEIRSLRNDLYRVEDQLRARMDALFARLEVRFDPVLAAEQARDRQS